MDEKGKDFAGDLKELESSIEVGDILAALNAQTKPVATRPAARPPPAKTKSAPVPLAARKRSRPLKAQVHTSPSRAERQQVTTRLTRETNELLTRSSLQQRLQELRPDTRQDIIEEAVREWAARRGYLRQTTADHAAEDFVSDAE